jgi:hypothetical protein
LQGLQSEEQHQARFPAPGNANHVFGMWNRDHDSLQASTGKTCVLSVMFSEEAISQIG